MPNDFEPVVGKRFTFTTRPIGAWNGVVHCEVLEVALPFSRLVYSWKGGADPPPPPPPPDFGSTASSPGRCSRKARRTRLRMVHAGFRSPQNDFAYGAMSPGWDRIIGRINEIAAAP